jgi:hypothetical protein
MTLQTDKRLCLGRETLQIDQGVRFTLSDMTRCSISFNCFRGQASYGKTAGAMAGLTVYQGQM